jgi:hypothetical protein
MHHLRFIAFFFLILVQVSQEGWSEGGYTSFDEEAKLSFRNIAITLMMMSEKRRKQRGNKQET